jgi:hypothetical protein
VRLGGGELEERFAGGDEDGVRQLGGELLENRAEGALRFVQGRKSS